MSVLADSGNYTFPSWYVTAFAITVFAMPFVLAPAGRTRKRAMTAAWIAVILVCLARLYLGIDYPTNVAYAAVLCWVLSEALYRWFVPDESFPVSYAKGGKAAHLDLSGARGEAVKTAMASQLGFDVAEVKPFGLAGSGGSSPLLMTMADGTRVFGKIYATSHVRADRWYRVGRTIMYGKLEDETPFSSVRRLAEYEDYALRVLAMNDVKVAQTWGIVELTPNREYMLVTGFFEDSRNLGRLRGGRHDHRRRPPADPPVLGHRCRAPRREAREPPGAAGSPPAGRRVGPRMPAHAVAPSRRPGEHDATLALQSDPDRVYQRATAFFTPDEIAEAFACAEGMAIPTELSGRLKQDPRPIMQRFKELAPAHAPVSIQRWSLQRIALTAAVVLGSLILLAMAITRCSPG